MFAALMLAGILPFLPGLKAPFFYDDANTIVMNPAIKAPANYGDFFSKLETFSADRSRMFRPLTTISEALNWKWFGDRTLGWHLTSLFAHTLCVLLVFILLESLSGSRSLAFLSALLFALHPSRVEPVLYISARSEIFASLFYLFSFWLFLKSQTQTKKHHEIILGIFSLLGFWLGLFSKDIAITLPAVLTLERVVFRKWNRKAGWWLGIFWANALIYLGLRRVLDLYTFFPAARPRPVADNLLLQARVIAAYLRELLLPVHNVVELKFSPAAPVEIALSIILLAAILICGLFLLRRKPLLGFFTLFFFIVISPSSSVVSLVVEGNITRVYLAGLAVFVVLAEVMLAAWKKSRKTAVMVIVFYFACLLALSLNWSKTWQSPIRLWSRTVASFPHHSRGHNNLGILLEKSGNYEQAEREYYFAVQSGPENAAGLVNYGRMLFARDELDRAELYFRKAVQLEPHNCPGRIAYSQLLITESRLTEAKELLDAIAFCPGYESQLESQKRRVNALLNLP